VNSDKTPIQVSFPKEPGAVAIVNMNRKKVNSLKLVINQTVLDGTQTGMAEVMVMGK
jgi:hypothetical protein